MRAKKDGGTLSAGSLTMGKKIISIMKDGVRYDLDEDTISKYSHKKKVKKGFPENLKKPGQEEKLEPEQAEKPEQEPQVEEQVKEQPEGDDPSARVRETIELLASAAGSPVQVDEEALASSSIGQHLGSRLFRKFVSKNEGNKSEYIQQVLQELASMSPEEQEDFIETLSPEEEKELEEIRQVVEGAQPVEGEEEVPLDENGQPVAGEEEVPVDEAGQPVEEVPVDEAGQPVAEEEQVPEEVVAEQPVVEEEVAKPLQVVCPHCKRPVTVSEEGPDQYSDQVPSALREPEQEQKGNPY